MESKVPAKDIELALKIESEVEDWVFYLECMNGKPMSMRTEAQELRDGCILTHHVYKAILRRKK